MKVFSLVTMMLELVGLCDEMQVPVKQMQAITLYREGMEKPQNLLESYSSQLPDVHLAICCNKVQIY